MLCCPSSPVRHGTPRCVCLTKVEAIRSASSPRHIVGLHFPPSCPLKLGMAMCQPRPMKCEHKGKVSSMRKPLGAGGFSLCSFPLLR